MEDKVAELIKQMTLEEKAGLCSGADAWHTKAVPRVGLPSSMVSDGPHGLRMIPDQSKPNDSIKAVCFPAACATACSFDRELLKQLGETLGEECRAVDVSILLGPAINMKRSPLCGRNFEYFSEDPYLAGELAAAYIQGVQSKGVGTSVKHFAANNQEYYRMTCSSQVDERTLREIYLAAFETAVKKGRPWTMMCSYNQINGVFASENRWLLTDVLRQEWGFSGYVMSDWGAVNDRVAGVAAGLDLEMPGSGGTNDQKLIEAVENGTFSETVLDEAAGRVVERVLAGKHQKNEYQLDLHRDHMRAVEIARECMVLLKNDGILPLQEFKNVAFIGAFAKEPRIQGGGSSHVNSFSVRSALEMAGSAVAYAQGFPIDEDRVDALLEEEAVALAKQAKTVVIFAGLPDAFESEGYDRQHLDLPQCQNRLIERICQVQENVIVVLHNGSPVTMPWLKNVRAVLEAYLSGEASGEAVVDLLLGRANPCGRLAETFPLRLQDTPCYLDYPGNGKTAEYREGLFIGYRWYDARQMEVQFPFGYGLSYTTFSYENLQVNTIHPAVDEQLEVSVDVLNTGNRAGKEVVQLYVADLSGRSGEPIQQLRDFQKIELQPGEKKTVLMRLDRRAFSFFDTHQHSWACPGGNFELRIAKSSREPIFSVEIQIEPDRKKPEKIHWNTTIGELMLNPTLREILINLQQNLLSTAGTNEAITAEMQLTMMRELPLRGLRSFCGVSNDELDALITLLNSVNEDA